MAANCWPYYCYTADILATTNSTQGLASLLMQYSDIAGNATIITSLLTGDSPVYIDTHIPQLSQIHLQSNNPLSTQKIGSGNLATLSFRSDEEIPLENMYADINGESISNFTQLPCETYCYSGSIVAPYYWIDGTAILSLSYSDIYGNSADT